MNSIQVVNKNIYISMACFLATEYCDWYIGVMEGAFKGYLHIFSELLLDIF